MFVLDDNGIKGECVITQEGAGVYEIKNIAVLPDYQRKGYGKSLIDFLLSTYTDCNTMIVGTGDVPSALTFYKKDYIFPGLTAESLLRQRLRCYSGSAGLSVPNTIPRFFVIRSVSSSLCPTSRKA